MCTPRNLYCLYSERVCSTIALSLERTEAAQAPVLNVNGCSSHPTPTSGTAQLFASSGPLLYRQSARSGMCMMRPNVRHERQPLGCPLDGGVRPIAACEHVCEHRERRL